MISRSIALGGPRFGTYGSRPRATRFSTVSGHSLVPPWGMNAICFASLFFGIFFMFSPPTNTSPFDNFCNPKIERIRVVFPEPFGPIRPIVSPDLMLKFILRRISFSPIETLRFETIVSVIAIYSEI